MKYYNTLNVLCVGEQVNTLLLLKFIPIFNQKSYVSYLGFDIAGNINYLGNTRVDYAL